MVVHHNTCVRAETGLESAGGLPTEVVDSVFGGLVPDFEQPRNVVADNVVASDHNAYDENGNYRFETYEPTTWFETLGAWRDATGGDANSQAQLGGVCMFAVGVDESEDYDLSVASGPCATLGSDGGEVGAFGFTTCVGHECVLVADEIR